MRQFPTGASRVCPFEAQLGALRGQLQGVSPWTPDGGRSTHKIADAKRHGNMCLATRPDKRSVSVALRMTTW